MKKILFLFALLISANAFSQTPPPNDNLTNATVLIGTDITFSGSLVGATLEGTEGANLNSDYGTLNASVWWSWTAPVSTVLNLEITSGFSDVVSIYAATNGTTSPAGLLPSLTNDYVSFGVPHFVVSTPVSAGTNYRIQLIGTSTNQYTFHLIATNTPLIYRQPVSQTVSSNASIMFYVESCGLPRTYQWFLNGTNLLGETAPIFALNHIDSTVAGSYTVVVTNAGGSVTSAPAILAVSTSNGAPRLRLISRQGSILTFSVDGEFGRGYRIESSSDLVHWSPENIFLYQVPYASTSIGYDNIVFSSNSSLQLTLTNASSRYYYRAIVYPGPDNHTAICINNLAQINIAKRFWQEDTRPYYVWLTPTMNALAPYLPHFSSIYCPVDEAEGFPTSYNIGNLATTPTCQIVPVTHYLEMIP